MTGGGGGGGHLLMVAQATSRREGANRTLAPLLMCYASPSADRTTDTTRPRRPVVKSTVPALRA